MMGGSGDRQGYPELGELAVGDVLIVVVNPNFPKLRHVRAQVIKVAPVWIDVKGVDEYLPPCATRFRRDNQTAKAKPESRTSRFYSEEQWAWRERMDRAHAYLQEIGVITRYGSPFEGDELGLANALRRGLGEEEL